MYVTQGLEMPDFKIVDLHLHLPVQQDDWLAPWREGYIAENGADRYAQLCSLNAAQPSWLPAFGFPEPDAPFPTWQQAAARWAEECAYYSLERVVFQTGGGNEMLAAVVGSNPALFSGFAHHSPEEDNAAETLEKAVTQQGLCGYKILAPLVGAPFADKRFDGLFEVCHQRRLPVLIHFGILGGAGGIVASPNQSPLSIAHTAQRFPHAKFIVPHFGCGFTNELLQLCWACPNVYVDTSGNNLWTAWTMENYTLEQLFARFLATVGAGRILFGSDSEWFPRGFAARYLADQLRAVRLLGTPEGDIKRIFRENTLELLQLT